MRPHRDRTECHTTGSDRGPEQDTGSKPQTAVLGLQLRPHHFLEAQVTWHLTAPVAHLTGGRMTVGTQFPEGKWQCNLSNAQ